MTTIDRVYRYGCHHPEPRGLAEQLLGQAWLYGEDLRRAYNANKRAVRELGRGDDAAHVVAYHHDALSAEIRDLRSRRGHLVDHGTYWLVEEAMFQASRASGLDPIRRRDFDGTGRVGAAIMSNERFSASEWRHKRVSLSEPDARGHAVLSIKVGALAAEREIRWPIKLHRPLPAGSVVKQVAVQRIRTGHRFRWEALVTIGMDRIPRATDSEARGVVGIDVGWRFERERLLRVATHDGGQEIDALLIDTLDSFEYADAVRSFRDRDFDAAKEYVKRVGLVGAEHAHLWRDKERMRRLATRTGDLGPVWWRERDRHLEDIECGNRTRAVRRRLDTFRVYADKLARRYRYVVLEDMPARDWVGEADTRARERRRSIASVSLLQTAIAERFGPERTHWEPSTMTSRTCSSCGEVRSESVGPGARWTCGSCGQDHHQDENAARVLRLLGERWIDGGNPPRARARRAKKRKEKEDFKAIATGDDRTMIVTPREPVEKAAE